MINYTVTPGELQVVLADSDGSVCQANNTDYSELAAVALDLVLTQNQGGNGWMDGLSSAMGGDQDYGLVTQLPATYSGQTPI